MYRSLLDKITKGFLPVQFSKYRQQMTSWYFPIKDDASILYKSYSDAAKKKTKSYIYLLHQDIGGRIRQEKGLKRCGLLLVTQVKVFLHKKSKKRVSIH